MSSSKEEYINVSDDQVKNINKQVREEHLGTDFAVIIENKTAVQLVWEITRLLEGNSV